MSILQEIQASSIKRMPDIRIGNTVRVHQRIKEGEKERTQIFEGLVLKINSGYGADKTFTVRKVVEGIGVEKIFPLFLPTIEKIEIKKESKVRRAKLYYMRSRSGKSARLKESLVSSVDWDNSVEELAEKKAEEEVEAPAEEAAEAPVEETAEAPAEETTEAAEAPEEKGEK